MRTPVRILLAVVGVVALAVMAAGAIVRNTIERRIADEIEALLAASKGERRAITKDDLVGLPEPVQRWLRWAQVIGKPLPATVRLTQEGRFRQAEGRPWMPFTAVEFFTTDPPGFLWRAMMRMAPGIFTSGRDRYADGRGSIDMRLLGLIPVARAAGQALDHGALLRYLNETMWFPAAALCPHISWERVDAHAARATMRFEGVTGEATFFFDDAGRPVNMVAERQDLAREHLDTWSTPLREYGEFGGMRVPVAGQGVWRYDTGDFPYIDLRITALETSS